MHLYGKPRSLFAARKQHDHHTEAQQRDQRQHGLRNNRCRRRRSISQHLLRLPGLGRCNGPRSWLAGVIHGHLCAHRKDHQQRANQEPDHMIEYLSTRKMDDCRHCLTAYRIPKKARQSLLTAVSPPPLSPALSDSYRSQRQPSIRSAARAQACPAVWLSGLSPAIRAAPGPIASQR